MSASIVNTKSMNPMFRIPFNGCQIKAKGPTVCFFIYSGLGPQGFRGNSTLQTLSVADFAALGT